MTTRNAWTEAFDREPVKPAGAKKVDLLGKDTSPLPSLRGPRSPKGVNGGMDADEDKARRLIRQKARRLSERRAAKKAVIPSEHAEQVAVIQWWAIYAAAHKLDPRLLMAIPNGAHLAGDTKARSIQMAKLKAAGLRVGAPDLLLAVPDYQTEWSGKVAHRHGLFIELKRLDGRLSPDQANFGTLLQSQDYAWVMAKGADAAIAAIWAYLRLSKTAQDAKIPRQVLAGAPQTGQKAVG